MRGVIIMKDSLVSLEMSTEVTPPLKDWGTFRGPWSDIEVPLQSGANLERVEEIVRQIKNLSRNHLHQFRILDCRVVLNTAGNIVGTHDLQHMGVPFLTNHYSITITVENKDRDLVMNTLKKNKIIYQSMSPHMATIRVRPSEGELHFVMREQSLRA